MVRSVLVRNDARGPLVRMAATVMALGLLTSMAACDGSSGTRRAAGGSTRRTASVSPVAPLTLTRDGAEVQFLAALNRRRSKLGLVPLAPDPRMVPVARAWAARMAEAGGISHNPDLRGEMPPEWRKYGENVGVGDTVASLHEAFLASPHHYVNIADHDYNSVGVGVVLQGRLIWVVFDFLESPAVPGRPSR